ncbi:hypothetical protein AB9P05_17855 [Roseivirga sp. BDSF3-8]|uniref:hypothetical protein n=1 Tax=Roseivirga sp. BDSF3-8 TaxID=3241598 RepID=UPI0035324B88
MTEKEIINQAVPLGEVWRALWAFPLISKGVSHLACVRERLIKHYAVADTCAGYLFSHYTIKGYGYAK